MAELDITHRAEMFENSLYIIGEQRRQFVADDELIS